MENIDIDSYSVYTNNVPAGTFRGFGWKQYYQEKQSGKVAQNGSKVRTKGIAIGLKAVLTPSISGAIVNLFADVSASVYCSTVDMGEGSDTITAASRPTGVIFLGAGLISFTG